MTVMENQTYTAIQRACRAIADDREHVDWEQRRYEIAKEALNALISLGGTDDWGEKCIASVNIADRLVSILQRPRTE